jgi:hypothetical protein
MNPAEPYREAVAPQGEQSMKLVLTPLAWRARMWRAFDDSVTPMLRLDAPLGLIDVEDRTLHHMLTPFVSALRDLRVYLQRGSATAFPGMPWSVGRVSVERDRATIFLHRVLDDPFGNVLSTLFRPDARADLTLAVVTYEVKPESLLFAVRDYDIGVGADFRR